MSDQETKAYRGDQEKSKAIPGRKVVSYLGIPIEKLPREELLDALCYAVEELHRLNKRHKSDLAVLAGKDRG